MDNIWNAFMQLKEILWGHGPRGRKALLKLNSELRSGLEAVIKHGHPAGAHPWFHDYPTKGYQGECGSLAVSCEYEFPSDIPRGSRVVLGIDVATNPPTVTVAIHNGETITLLPAWDLSTILFRKYGRVTEAER